MIVDDCTSERQDVATAGRPAAHPREDRTDIGLYLHVPFCHTRCHFCAFYLAPHRAPAVRDYLSAVKRELQLLQTAFSNQHVTVATIYLGGGTPTILPCIDLAEMIGWIRNEYEVCPSVEITVEATPETVTVSGVDQLRQAGVNRLSLGAQTLNDHEWSRLGRSGDPTAIEDAVRLAGTVGIANINVDLIYGLPGQTVESWRESVLRTIDLGPAHVSCYALTIEEGTRFDAEREAGTLLTDAAQELAMEREACRLLGDHAYARYEVANFSKRGYECRHNLRYWSGQDYLGVGPSAHSYFRGVRFQNVADLGLYASLVGGGRLAATDIEPLSVEQRYRERVAWGLRLMRGVPLDIVDYCARDQQWRRVLHQCMEREYLCRDNHALRLTEAGRRWSDIVARELLWV